jgi:predicted acylesterase/phospholipase RssA
MLDPEEIQYDVVEGVSIGGINASILAMFAKGDEKAAIDYLYQMWLNTPVTSMWSNWEWVGPLAGLWKSSVLDN